MAAHDITGDFLSLVATLPPPPQVNRPTASPPVSSLKEFHAASSSIARDIHTASTKLSALTKLVQSQSSFSDPTQQINELVHDIKQDIQSLNSQLDGAQSYVESRKAQMAGGAAGQPAAHSQHVVGQLKAELLNATKTFKDVLQARSSNLKEQAERKDRLGLGFNKQSAVTLGRPAVFKPIATPGLRAVGGGGGGGNMALVGALNGGPLPEGAAAAAAAAAAVAAGGGSMDDALRAGMSAAGGSAVNGGAAMPPPPYGASTGGLHNRHGGAASRGGGALPRPGMVTALVPDGDDAAAASAYAGGADLSWQPLIPSAEQRLAQAQLIPDQSYLESRTNAMAEVEAHILELGTVFNRLATMIQDQRELVENVHDNIEDAEANVNRGQLALLGTLRALQSNRALVAKVSGILLVFLLFFIIFLA